MAAKKSTKSKSAKTESQASIGIIGGSGELGGNDMLNETDPQTVFGNLDQIIRLCKAEGARVPECYRSLNSGPCTRPRSIQSIQRLQPGIRSPLFLLSRQFEADAERQGAPQCTRRPKNRGGHSSDREKESRVWAEPIFDGARLDQVTRPYY